MQSFNPVQIEKNIGFGNGIKQGIKLFTFNWIGGRINMK